MAQLHLGPTHVRIRPLNSRKLVAVLSSLGKLFHTRADSNLNDLCPYVTVLTVGILTVFSYLKEYFVCLSSTKSLRYSGDMLLIHLYVLCLKIADITFKVVTSKITDKYLVSRKVYRMFNIQV